ncbi:MAG: hypothetical protein E6R03_13630 [Hyphomicrobiaceae bacterium]|nr:MAG: hypothetical protein E6R03_13630 [Hyphomicrobiaceae bacterium]
MSNGIHPFIRQAIEDTILTRFDLKNQSIVEKEPTLAVIDLELKDNLKADDSHDGKAYYATLTDGSVKKLTRVSKLLKYWKGQEYNGESSAAAIGTAVHKAIELILQGKIDDALDQPHDPEVIHCLVQFMDWLEANPVELVASEARVWNIHMGLAGTLDALVKRGNKYWLLDFKSTSVENCTKYYYLQQWAYAQCLTRFGIVLDGISLLCLPKPSHGDKPTELVLWERGKPDYDKFSADLTACLTSLVTLNNNFNQLNPPALQKKSSASPLAHSAATP